MQRDPAHVEQVEAEQSDVRASVRRSRVLPAWMMAAVAALHSSSSSTTGTVFMFSVSLD